MKLYFIILLAVSVDVSYTTKLFRKFHQQICLKEGVNLSANAKIKIGTKSFKDLVQHSDVFVDKSLFIKSILETGPMIALAYPKKWGKSTNLDMLKSFVELAIDSKGNVIPRNSTWSYRYFKHGVVAMDDGKSSSLTNPPLISLHENIMDEFLGKYPVVYLDLSSFEPVGNNLEGFYKAFGKIISGVFATLEYLINSSSGKNQVPDEKVKIFNKYKKSETSNTDELSKSLEFISELLFSRFKKRVFILIDGYDKVLRNAFLEVPSQMEATDGEKFSDFYLKFMKHTFKDNKYLHTGVVVGVLNLAPHLLQNGFHNFSMLSKNIEPFFGFTRFEVNQMFTQLSIAGKLMTEAFAWYCEYRMADFSEIPICNPWSIVNFVNTKKLQIFWADAKNCEIFANIMDNKDVRNVVIRAIGGSLDVAVDRNALNFNLESIKSLQKISRNVNSSITNEDLNLILSLYSADGYFSLNPESLLYLDDMKVSLKIPGKEITFLMVEMLKNWYKKRWGDEACHFAKLAANALVQSLHVKYGNQTTLFNGLTEAYKRLPRNYRNDYDGKYYYVDKELMDEWNFFILLYAASDHGYCICRNVVYYSEFHQVRKLQHLAMYGQERGLALDFHLLYNVQLMHEVWLKAKELHSDESFFKTKPVKLVRFMMLAYNDQNNTVGAFTMDGHSPDFKCGERNCWSHNFGLFNDYDLYD